MWVLHGLPGEPYQKCELPWKGHSEGPELNHLALVKLTRKPCDVHVLHEQHKTTTALHANWSIVMNHLQSRWMTVKVQPGVRHITYMGDQIYIRQKQTTIYSQITSNLSPTLVWHVALKMIFGTFTCANRRFKAGTKQYLALIVQTVQPSSLKRSHSLVRCPQRRDCLQLDSSVWSSNRSSALVSLKLQRP